MIAGGVLCGMARAARTKRAFGWLALAGLVGLGVLSFKWQLLWAEVRALGELASPLVGYVRPAGGNVPPASQLLPLLAELWPGVWELWCQILLASPLIALYIFSTRVKTAEDLERERLARLETRARADAQKAAERSAKTPEAAEPGAWGARRGRSGLDEGRLVHLSGADVGPTPGADRGQ